MVSKAAEKSSKINSVTLSLSLDDRILYGFEEEQFRLTDIWYMQTDSDWIYLNYLCVNLGG